jgi:hypothetical protein
MAKDHEPEERDDQWGNQVAKATFIATAISVALFVGSVFVFILH